MSQAFGTPETMLQIPFAEIDRAIKMRKPNRDDYIVIKRAVSTWLASVLGPDYFDKLRGRPTHSMEFVDYKLTPEEKQEALALLHNDKVDILETVNELMLGGYRFTFTFDSKNDCVIVSLMGKELGHINYNKCMTSRHQDVIHALAIAVYKQQVVFADQPWSMNAAEDTYG